MRRHSPALVVLSAVLTACLGPESTPEVSVQVTTDLFEITPDTVTVVELHVANDGWEPVLAGVGCPFYIVHDAVNAPVSSATCIPEAFLVVTVQPGMTETLLRFAWNGHGQGLSPGPYRIESTVSLRTSSGVSLPRGRAWAPVWLIR